MHNKLFYSISLFLFLAINPTISHAQWQQTNGPYGGTIVCMAVSGTNILAGTHSGIFLSTNNGGNWTAVNNGLPFDTIVSEYATINSFAVSGTNIFAATGGRGMFLSINNGSSWTAVDNGLTNFYVNAITISGTNIFAATEGGGVFLSTNNGSSWIPVNSGLTNLEVYSLVASGTKIFAGTYGGVFLSTNNGSSWTAVNNGLTNTFIYSLAISGTNIFAATDGGGVFLSTNNGSNWTAVNSGLTSGIVWSLAISGTNIFAGTDDGGVCLSSNNGSSWTAMNSGLTNTTVLSLVTSGTNIFAGTNGGGVCLSINNGSSWTAMNSGLTNTSVLSLAASGTNIFAGTDGGDAFLSSNNGSSWTAMNSGLTNTYVYSLAISGANIFAGTLNGVFLSANNGDSWTAVNSGLPQYTFVFSIAINGTNIFAGTEVSGVFLSTNNGANWTAVNTGLTNTQVNSLAVSGSNIFAGTYGGGVFLSTNNGNSWTAINTGLTHTYVWSLAIIGTNIFAGTDGGVFLSTNNGSTWTAANNGMVGVSVSALAITGTNIFAGTNAGVFLSTNNGANWTAVNDSLISAQVNSLALSGTNIFAGTVGGGVWERPLSDFVVYPPQLDHIGPTQGGNTGDVTITFFGRAFGDSTQVKLTRSGYADIVAPDSLTTLTADGNEVVATFNLRGQQVGLWNAVMTIPNDTEMTLTNAFNIIQGSPAQVWCNILGPSQIRVNQFGNFSLNFGNTGIVDATAVPLWLAIPDSMVSDFSFQITNPQDTLFDYDTIPNFAHADTVLGESFSGNVYQFLVRRIPPGQTASLNFRLKMPFSGSKKLMAGIRPPLYASPLNPQLEECYTAVFKEIDDKLGDLLGLPVVDCFNDSWDNVYKIWKDSPWFDNNPDYGTLPYILDYSKSLFSMVADCVIDVSGTRLSAIENMAKVAYEFSGYVHLASSCIPYIFTTVHGDKNFSTVISVDPNEKYGPTGLDSLNTINAKNPLSYVIKFENDTASTAATQNILIIDSLNKSLLNLNSFRFGNIMVGTNTLYPVTSLSSYQDEIDLRPAIDLLVRVTATLDTASGVAQWLFQSIDPLTDSVTTNPLLGFLLPDTIPPNGEGFVSYSVLIKDSIKLNSVVSNTAYIYFDSNPAVQTNNWTNRIDNVKPVSKVDSLPPFETDSLFTVSWAGSDTSSGLLDYTIYYSVNGGTYKVWISDTRTTSATFSGTVDSTYHFYSIARDSAYNVEDAPATPDASTTIEVPAGIKSFDMASGNLLVYPNPANTEIYFVYNLPASSQVYLRIFNLLGQQSYDIMNETQSQGIHKFRTDASNIAQGTYLCELRYGNSVKRSKLVIIK